MKKILMLFAAAALVLGAVSCQKENLSQTVTPGEEQIDYSNDPMGVIKVYIKKDDTKMGFKEQGNALCRNWEEKDVIDGCTPVTEGEKTTYKTFSYEVIGATTEYITLKKKTGEPGVPSAAAGTKVNFVYAPGAVSFDETTGACSLDLSKQDESHIPAVMVASGTVGEVDGDGIQLSLKFENIAAVLAIKSPSLKDFDETAMTGTFSKVSVSALTKGKLTLGDDDGYVTLTDDEYTPNWDGSVEAGVATVTAKETNFGTDVYVAVLPGNYTDITAKVVDAKNGETRLGSFKYTASPNKAIAANAYLRIKDKGFARIPVAEIGGTKYAYVSDAFDNVQDGQTVNMINDSEGDDSSLPAGKTVTLNLGGKVLGGSIMVNGNLIINDETENGKIVNSNTCINVLAGGSLTLNGGSIEATSADYATVYVNKDAEDGKTTTATFNGGKIVQYGGASAGALYAKKSTISFPENSSAHVLSTDSRAFYAGTGSDVTFKSGCIESQETYPIFINIGSGHTVTIDGGTFIGKTHCLHMYGSAASATVTGGKFEWGEESNFVSLNSSAKAANVNISGGYLLRQPFTANFTMPDGYGVQELETPFEGKYAFMIGNNPDPVVKVKFNDDTEKDYTSLDDALSEVVTANDTATLTLLKDCEVKTKCDLSDNVRLTIDLNGNQLTVVGATRINVAENSPNAILSIRDESENKNGRLYQKNNGDTYVMDINSGTFNLYSGNIETNAGTQGGIRSKGGTINIYGGCVKGATDYGTVYCNNANGVINITGGVITGLVSDEKDLSGAVRLSAGVANISGGTITGAGKGALYLTGGVANVSGGTFTTSEYNDYELRICYVKNATVNMTDGTMGTSAVVMTDKYIYRAVYVDEGGIFNLSNGNLRARRSIFYCKSTAKVNMSGGTIRTGASGSSYYTFAFADAASSQVTIEGGNVYTYGANSKTFGTIPSSTTVTLKGGKYTKQPSSYAGVTIPEGYEEVPIAGDATYKYMIQEVSD